MLKPYEKIGFVDHVVDQDTGEIVQQGTALSKRTLGYMDDSLAEIYAEFDELYNNLALTAENIEYSNPDLPGVENVKQALDSVKQNFMN